MRDASPEGVSSGATADSSHGNDRSTYEAGDRTSSGAASQGGGSARPPARGKWRALEPGWELPKEPPRLALLIASRVAVFLVLVAGVYWVFWRSSYALFAPHLELVRAVIPSGIVSHDETHTLGVVVRNTGWSWGAAFVVAALGEGVEVEGPTVDVPARDSALVPVEVTLGPGDNTLSLVLFDGWRGVRRLHTYRGLHIRGGFRELEAEAITLDESVVRGDTLEVAFEWSNPRRTPEMVIPIVVFRQESGTGGTPIEGPATRLEPGESGTLRFPVDTWMLQPGTYTAQISVMSDTRERIGYGSYPRPVTVSAR
jgi:hypothetical protein